MSTSTSEMTLKHAANIRVAESTSKYEEETVKQDSVQDSEWEGGKVNGQGGRVIQNADIQWKKCNRKVGVRVEVII